MDRRDLASEEEEEYDSAEEEGSFTQSEDEADLNDGVEQAAPEDAANSPISVTHCTEERGPAEDAAEEVETAPAAVTSHEATAGEADIDDDAELEGALESVEEGMQALNVDDEVISQGGEEDPEDGQLGDGDSEAPPGAPAERQPQPYDVPTKGTFWLHDDRHGGGDGRRRPVRRKKIWEPTDDPWKHDMFEQLEAGRADRFQEPQQASDRRGRRGPQRGASRDYSRNGNIRAANANAARSLAPDDEAPPGYERPQFREPTSNGWAAERDAAPAASNVPAARSGGGGWWETGPSAEPEQAAPRGRGRNQGRGGGRKAAGRSSGPSPAASGGEWATEEAPAGAQQGMQYQYIMPAAAGGSGVSVPAPPGGAWVQVPAAAAMGGGFQMMPAEVFGSGSQQAFVPGPMMMGMGYPMGMRPAMVKPVRRPITIQAPPDAQSAADANPSGQNIAPTRTGGRRYSAMTGRLAEDASTIGVVSNA
ncbi:hypothetical protein WJX84_011053 [Apatococcus fuscideae]|uniref:Btz domain-containing protein n=1 Tax=Apatococcus fuscideae TaxID=2026836 RepID=A0AAW1SJV1_9CHLO